MTDAGIIIGQEVVFINADGHKEVGRLSTYSSWSGDLEHVMVKPYVGKSEIKVKPNNILRLIDPRPIRQRFWDFFRTA